MAPSLEEATAHIQSGNLSAAQEVLAQLLRINIRDEQAWFLLAQCVTDQNQRFQCLQRVLAIDPDHQLAQRLLAEFKPPTAAGTESFQPREFELADSLNEARAVSTESFQPRAFELAAKPDSETVLSRPPVPAYAPRPFVLTDFDPNLNKDSKQLPQSLPAWIRPPTTNE